MKKTHLTPDDRTRIETLLSEGRSIRYIADRLDKAPSTVSREISKHKHVVLPRNCDCIYLSDCSHKHVCGSSSCRGRCSNCSKARKFCGDYVKAYCDYHPDAHSQICNACHKKTHCHYERHIYEAKKAEKEYRKTLVDTRSGFDLTCEDLIRIDELVSPLVRRGQSIYHIVKSNSNNLTVSESTLRRLIAASELDARNIDLPEAVKRKQRQKKTKPSMPPVSKTGHLYTDYLKYIHSHDVCVVQMDCIEGRRDEPAALLTLHFTSFHMQLVNILNEQTASCVVAMLDAIELSIGKELFASYFPVILTDNGHEFTDIKGIECSVFGGKRTHVFFCEANRSDQKAECETNHKLVRRIIPKGSSIQHLMQMDMVLLTNHINSYKRESLFGKSPFEAAMTIMSEDFFVLLGLECIPANEVNLTPSLLKR